MSRKTKKFSRQPNDFVVVVAVVVAAVWLNEIFLTSRPIVRDMKIPTTD